MKVGDSYMWLYRLRWYLQVFSKRRAAKGFAGPSIAFAKGRNQSKLLPVLILLLIVTLSIFLLRSIWNVFMQGFLASTPWIPGSQTGTYYWNSIMFAAKSTVLVGVLILLVTFLLGMQISKVRRR